MARLQPHRLPRHRQVPARVLARTDDHSDLASGTASTGAFERHHCDPPADSRSTYVRVSRRPLAPHLGRARWRRIASRGAGRIGPVGKHVAVVVDGYTRQRRRAGHRGEPMAGVNRQWPAPSAAVIGEDAPAPVDGHAKRPRGTGHRGEFAAWVDAGRPAPRAAVVGEDVSFSVGRCADDRGGAGNGCEPGFAVNPDRRRPNAGAVSQRFAPTIHRRTK